MCRLLVSLVLGLVSVMPLASVALAQSSITIAPVSGSESDEYAVAGVGLMPGLALDINFQSPEGDLYNLGDDVWVVDADGDFEFNFVPASEFAGSSKGTWMVQVCASGTDNCVQGTFDIN